MKQIKEIVLTEVECLNHGDLDGVCACYTEDVVFEDVSDPSNPAVGMAAFRESMAGFFDGFSDLKVDIQRMLLSEDRQAMAIEYILTGTHDGVFAGIAPTGKKINANACSVYDLRGDLICKERIYWDMGEILSQLK
ncbi:MAG: ester cyclase [Christensenella sp.]|nr:ester cyclase [Christensenella sp.]